MKISTCELYLFLRNIHYYEEGIYDIIKYYMNTYTFKDNDELHIGINLWCDNRNKCIENYGHISEWDVSNITNMQWMFANCYYFNQDISRWDISNVYNMENMFFNAPKFNQDISGWDVRKVTRTNDMFNFCFIKNKYKPIFKIDL